MIIVAISKYIEIVVPTFLVNKSNYRTQKINRSQLIKNVSIDLLFLLFYKKLNNHTIQKIINLLFDLINKTYLIEDNRYEPRKRKLPLTEFTNNKCYDNG